MRNDETLDPVDRRLIALLKANARLSATALAQAVGLSRTAVQGRLARLERDGVITGYTALTRAPNAPGATQAILSLRIDRRPCAVVLDRFKDWPEVIACWSTAGPVDAVALVEADGPEALSRLIDRLGAVPGMGAIETKVVLATVVGHRAR